MPVQTQTPASRNTGSMTSAAASNVQQAYVPQIQKTVSREPLLVNMDDHGMIFFLLQIPLLTTRWQNFFIFLLFFWHSTFVSSSWSFGFFIPATTANDLRLRRMVAEMIWGIVLTLLLLISPEQ